MTYKREVETLITSQLGILPPPETVHHYLEMDGDGPKGGLQPARVANPLSLGKKHGWKNKSFNDDLFSSTLVNFPVLRDI